MKTKMITPINNNMGELLIDTNVIATYAGMAAVECAGITGMAMVSVTDGLVKLLKRENITKGINIMFDEDNMLEIDFHVIVSYGVSICTVVDNLIDNVKYKVQEYTGLKIKKINVYVDGVRVID